MIMYRGHFPIDATFTNIGVLADLQRLIDDGLSFPWEIEDAYGFIFGYDPNTSLLDRALHLFASEYENLQTIQDLAGNTINQVKSMIDWLKDGNRPIGYLSDNTIDDVRKTLKVMYKLDGKAKNLFFAPWQVLAIVEGKAFGLIVNLGFDVIRFVRHGVGDLMEFFRPD